MRPALDRVADVAQNGADLTAQEEQGDDGDDRDEGEDECVFGEALSLIVPGDPFGKDLDQRTPVLSPGSRAADSGAIGGPTGGWEGSTRTPPAKFPWVRCPGAPLDAVVDAPRSPAAEADRPEHPSNGVPAPPGRTAPDSRRPRSPPCGQTSGVGRAREAAGPPRGPIGPARVAWRARESRTRDIRPPEPATPAGERSHAMDGVSPMSTTTTRRRAESSVGIPSAPAVRCPKCRRAAAFLVWVPERQGWRCASCSAPSAGPRVERYPEVEVEVEVGA